MSRRRSECSDGYESQVSDSNYLSGSLRIHDADSNACRSCWFLASSSATSLCSRAFSFSSSRSGLTYAVAMHLRSSAPRVEITWPQRPRRAPAEFFALFRRHLFPSFSHAVPPVHSASAAEAAKENLAQQQDANRLPEVNRMPSDDRGNKPVPQVLHNDNQRLQPPRLQSGEFRVLCRAISFSYFASFLLQTLHRSTAACGADTAPRSACATTAC